MSTGSDFAPGGLLFDLVGRDGCSAIANEILDGSFDAEQLRDINRSDVNTLIEFIKQMARPTKDGDQVPDME